MCGHRSGHRALYHSNQQATVLVWKRRFQSVTSDTEGVKSWKIGMTYWTFRIRFTCKR